MKLYATTTTERASKGQGGNEYLHIDITDETGQAIAKIHITTFENGRATMNWDNYITNVHTTTTMKLNKKGEKTKTHYYNTPLPQKGCNCRLCKQK